MKHYIYSDEYISYIESGESSAVLIVRDIVKSINTKGKWVELLKYFRGIYNLNMLGMTMSIIIT